MLFIRFFLPLVFTLVFTVKLKKWRKIITSFSQFVVWTIASGIFWTAIGIIFKSLKQRFEGYPELPGEPEELLLGQQVQLGVLVIVVLLHIFVAHLDIKILARSYTLLKF